MSTLLSHGLLAPSGTPPVLPIQSYSDETTIALWLHGRSATTRRAYESDARAFLALSGKLLRQVIVGDVQAYAVSLIHLAPVSQARRVSSVKSLLSFAHRIGYTPFNVGAVVKLPPVKGTLAERITGEAELHRMLALETDSRNAAMLCLVYGAGLRRSEVCGLKWRDLQPRSNGGQATIFGKGGKTRVVLLPPGLWRSLVALRANAGLDAPVFMSQRRGHLDPSQVHRVLRPRGGAIPPTPHASSESTTPSRARPRYDRCPASSTRCGRHAGGGEGMAFLPPPTHKPLARGSSDVPTSIPGRGDGGEPVPVRFRHWHN